MTGYWFFRWPENASFVYYNGFIVLSMKKIYAILLAFLPLMASAQFNYEFTGDSVVLDELGRDIEFDLEVVNLDPTNAQTVRWRIINNDFVSAEWEDYVCDVVCYTPAKRWNDIVLEPDTTFPIIHHIRMRTDHGTGTSTLCFFDPADSAATIQCKTITAISDTTVGIEILQQQTSLNQNSPNPFSNHTSIRYELSSSDGYLKIHDLTGKLVREFYLNSSRGQVIVDESLEAGLYFYSLWDSGQMVGSKRMQVVD